MSTPIQRSAPEAELVRRTEIGAPVNRGGGRGRGPGRFWAEVDPKSGKRVWQFGITGQSNLDAANTDYLDAYSQYFADPAAASTMVADAVLIQPTSTLNVSIPIVNAFPLIRQWLGEKEFKNLRAYRQTIPVATWEASIALPRLQVDGDATGATTGSLNGFLASAADSYEYQFATLFRANTWTGYDAVSLLNASHPNTNSTGNNLTTNPLSYSSYQAAKQALRAFTDENGRPFNKKLDLRLLVGPNNERVALDIVGRDRPISVKSDGTYDQTSAVGATVIPNAYASDAAVIVSPYLTTQWLLFNVAYVGVRPFYLAEKRALEPQMQTAWDSDARFLEDEYRYSLEGDLGFAPGLWQSCYGSVS